MRIPCEGEGEGADGKAGERVVDLGRWMFGDLLHSGRCQTFVATWKAHTRSTRYSASKYKAFASQRISSIAAKALWQLK
jgi:hypothetical protein